MPIYYLDECMFTTRTYMQKEYAAPNDNIMIGASEFGISATAFLGVVCADKGLFHYQLFERSVNGERFQVFLRNLKKKHGDGKLILYLDNLAVHKSVQTR